MSPLEAIFFWISLVIYAMITGGVIFSIVFKREGFYNKIPFFLLAGLVIHTLAIIARTSAQGHLPWAGDYENGLVGGWFIILLTVYINFRYRHLRFISAGTVPVVLLIMGYGVMRNPTLAPMAASLKSIWLYIHVFFAWLAFGSYTLALGIGVLYLLKKRDSKKINKNPILEKIPPLEGLDDLIFKYIVFGFITEAIMIASGAIWAKDLWGHYWNWDPVETWSLISLLMYGFIIHLRVTFGWRGKRIAWLSIFAIITMLITFFGVSFLVESSLHIFNVR